MDEGGFNYDVEQDTPMNRDFTSSLASGTNSMPLESSDAAASDHVTEDPELQAQAQAQAQRRYLSKRPHRKSRAGCKQCKKRKVKCDEAKPSCKACTLRKEPCVYPNVPPPASSSTATRLSTGATDSQEARDQSVDNTDEGEEIEDIDVSTLSRIMIPVISEPVFIPDQAVDHIDMKMLWFYTAHSYHNFSINAGRLPLVDYALKVKVVEHAFRSPFLMETVKALSALDLRNLNQPVPTQKLVSYQARAFEGYRSAIETADPKDYPALLACSLFMVAMSSQAFRDPNGRRLFIVEWIAIWRGIGLIIDMISPKAVEESGLSALFYRPPIDMEKTVQYIPNNLLFMVTSIRDGDADYANQKDYYEFLRCLGSLYQELIEHGFGPVLDLRIITFFSFCPRVLIPLAQQHRPRMLVIIAHWICFVRILRNVSWWMTGLERQAEQIFEEVDDDWEHLLRVPKMVMVTDDRVQRARLIIDNHNWTPSELDLYHKNRDPRTRNELKLITNEGAELEIVDGQWRFKTSQIRWHPPHMPDSNADPDHSDQTLLLGSTLLYNPVTRNPVSAQLPVSTPSPSISSELSTPSLSPSISASKSPSP
ncbi:hypothetical protein F5B22DRAFT_69716 [Xylaria bambusicola]|uniref:uncharacterized protein n=1 Tax=Xylaria bambusicola TaxID=326684 RepID=UPI002008D0E8|nr:uncharacterized protein F5B22DRAFT_69716 [Xylaria bambusicola]KAI0518542.1 hypothetical protein F5B22DRAFT_69716 [Xylaria bambusicola]